MRLVGRGGLATWMALALSYLSITCPAVRCTEVSTTKSSSSYRLPDKVSPTTYHLEFEPDLTHATFQGRAVIALTVNQPTPTVVLNCVGLKILSATIRRANSLTAKTWLGTVSTDIPNERIGITFPQSLDLGDYELSLSFSGKLNDKLRGFYRATYLDAQGKTTTLAATQMEPTDARRMFPCFDEPAYKARFVISAVIDPGLTAISNAAVSQMTHCGKKVLVTFAQTPPMSSYLVALIVGHLEGTEPITVDGIPIRVWSSPGKKALGQYAQQAAGKLLTYYRSYFGIAYPSTKLDLIAIPDFEAGAMENLGAITFRERALLVDEKTASSEARQSVFSIVAHEVAHMWFGDLVTMDWWDDLWLNEAFATWMSAKAVDQLMPQWHFWDQFGLGRSGALSSDALQSTHSIHFPVENPNQANEMFDEIIYEKGASILRMLETYIGEAAFQSGVRRYLQQHAWSNASTEELWKAMEQSSGRPIPQMMGSWINQAGYPLVSITRLPQTNQIHIQQSRFFLDPPAAGTASPELWQIPITLKGIEPENAGSKSFVLDSSSSSLPAPPFQIFLANANSNGFYRVQYSTPLLLDLIPLIQTRLSVAERLSLLSDQWALTMSGHCPIDQYLQLTESYKTETDPSVMTSLIAQLQQLDRFVDQQSRPHLAAFIRDRLLPSKNRLGWTAKPGESDLDKILRSKVLQTLGTIGQDQQTIDEARSLFLQLQQHPDNLDPNLVKPVILITAYNGNAADYAQLKQLWLAAKTPEAQERNLMALGWFQSPDLICKSQQLALSNNVRIQDAPGLLGTLLGNQAAKADTWQFIKQNWARIQARFSLNMVPRLISGLGALTLPEEEEDLRMFFQTHPLPAGQHSIAKMLERVKINVDFQARNAQQLNGWLAAHYH